MTEGKGTTVTIRDVVVDGVLCCRVNDDTPVPYTAEDLTRRVLSLKNQLRPPHLVERMRRLAKWRIAGRCRLFIWDNDSIVNAPARAADRSGLHIEFDDGRFCGVMVTLRLPGTYQRAWDFKRRIGPCFGMAWARLGQPRLPRTGFEWWPV